MGTETTIAGFEAYDSDAAPEFFRARKAMQYADNLDRFVQIMTEHNNGGYANSWLLGDVHSGEIMLFELGLRYSNVERKTDGYFAGFNAPQDPGSATWSATTSSAPTSGMPSGRGASAWRSSWSSTTAGSTWMRPRRSSPTTTMFT